MTCTIPLQHGWENCWSNLAIFNQPKKTRGLKYLKFYSFSLQSYTINHKNTTKLQKKKKWKKTLVKKERGVFRIINMLKNLIMNKK